MVYHSLYYGLGFRWYCGRSIYALDCPRVCHVFEGGLGGRVEKRGRCVD